MYEVYDERGKKTQNPDDILTLQCNYYRKLYTAKKDVLFMVEGQSLNAISEEDQEQLELLLTYKEL